MKVQKKTALILGAVSPLGAASALAADPREYDRLILAADTVDEPTASALSKRLRLPASNIHVVTMDISQPFAGLPESLLNEKAAPIIDIFHAAHCVNRSIAASDLHSRNTLLLERVFSIAYTIENLGVLTVITDVGLAGDYPGRFSEAWTDVGQTPFDDVDKSSLQIELICLEEKRLPIIRGRAGLTLLPKGASDLLADTQAPSAVLLGSVSRLAKLPRFITLPAAVAEGCLAPVTPSDWAAAALMHLVREKKGIGEAHHLIVTPKPPMQTLLDAATELLGGPRIKGGLPTDAIARLGRIPGLKEIARRNADQVSAWFTPHRYCLSRNDLDTSRLESLLPSSLWAPSWSLVKNSFS
jgi:hypothetical protein